jgi:hypothetical protein
MNRRFARRARVTPFLAGAALLACAVTPVHAQVQEQWRPAYGSCPAPLVIPQPDMRATPVPAEPGTTTPPAMTPTPQEAPATPEASLADARAGAGLGESFAMASGAYLDSAIPVTQFRLRYTAANDDNRPDRAEFFYGKCGCFGPSMGGVGPPKQETDVSYRDISGYLEYAVNNRLSGFVEVPYRWLEPEQNAHANGFADMNAGFKFALLADPCQYLTFQFRTYAPTGDVGLGLGTGHASLEPALLYWRQFDRLQVQGQLNDWIAIPGTDFSGNVLSYGVGASYDVYNNHNLRIAPVVEFVGWSVLNGKELDVNPANPNVAAVKDAGGETIVNGKFGLRFWLGNSTLYAGYGHALTGTVWYKEIFRVEYAVHF